MSHYTVTLAVELPEDQMNYFGVHAHVGKMLEPYDENATADDYLVFCPVDDLKDDYETGMMTAVQMSNGIRCSPYDARFSDNYIARDGKVYKRHFGPQRTPKRTKKAKQMKVIETTLKKVYPTLADYAVEHCGYSYSKEEDAFGYYSNPDAKWDWWQIGGRWPFEFLVKEDCASVIKADFSWRNKDAEAPAPEGYRWVAGARKSDIQWEKMKELRVQELSKSFEILEKWFLEDIKPEDADPFLARTEDGIKEWQSMVYIKGETLEEFLDRRAAGKERRFSYEPYAVLNDKGWQGSGDMGWFGCSSNNVEVHSWNRTVEEFIASTPDHYFLVSVDCHI